MDDFEPGSPKGDFTHRDKFGDGTPNPCVNANKSFHMGDSEVEPFVRKRTRRNTKRIGHTLRR